MKKLMIAGLLTVLAQPAAADPSFSLTGASCANVQAAVQAAGSVILKWQSKSGMPLYGRYVSDRRYCHPGEIVTFASVPVADKSCSVKRCVQRGPNSR